MSVQQCQSKSASTVDDGRLFHLGMVLGKSCICKHLLLKKELTVYICDL